MSVMDSEDGEALPVSHALMAQARVRRQTTKKTLQQTQVGAGGGPAWGWSAGDKGQPINDQILPSPRPGVIKSLPPN